VLQPKPQAAVVGDEAQSDQSDAKESAQLKE